MAKREINFREVKAGTFQPFKNGLLNLNTPASYNWALGYSVPYPNAEKSRLNVPQSLPMKRINGQHISY